ncbi:MAG: hypothetical protein M3220_21105 [Chloroflexota bacterium]|nr:hypothetical protein [Chloroflexota bacterium]
MNQEQVWRDFLALPRTAQEEVHDFIAFLHTRYPSIPPESDDTLPALRDEPFIGMWRDRTDMIDSSAWVRTLRMTEWGVDNGKSDHS